MENNWTEICAKCMEGDIEPHYCEYYGEPNGCNSPTYGKHPPTPSAAAMYSCLVKILAEMIALGGIERGKKAHFSPDAIADEIRQALAAPPRNCDKVKDHSDAIGKFEKWMDFSPKTADEQDAFFKEHWFEFATWLIDMNESEVAK